LTLNHPFKIARGQHRANRLAGREVQIGPGWRNPGGAAIPSPSQVWHPGRIAGREIQGWLATGDSGHAATRKASLIFAGRKRRRHCDGRRDWNIHPQDLEAVLRKARPGLRGWSGRGATIRPPALRLPGGF